MKVKFFENLKHEVNRIQDFGNSRIKIDWIYPDALGLESNKLDEYHRHDIFPAHRRQYFCELIQKIAERIGKTWNEVLRAFFGNKSKKFAQLQNQISQNRRDSHQS